MWWLACADPHPKPASPGGRDADPVHASARDRPPVVPVDWDELALHREEIRALVDAGAGPWAIGRDGSVVAAGHPWHDLAISGTDDLALDAITARDGVGGGRRALALDGAAWTRVLDLPPELPPPPPAPRGARGRTVGVPRHETADGTLVAVGWRRGPARTGKARSAGIHARPAR